MSTVGRQKKATAAIWTVLSLLVIVLVILSFFTLIARRTQEKDPATEDTTGTATQQTTELTQPKDTTPAEKHTTPVVTTVEDAVAETPEDKPASIDSLTFVLPISGGTVTKGYSDSVATFSLTMNDYRVHTGVDLYAPVGTHVLACADGVIDSIYEDPFLGNCIRIDHGAGLKSVYCNLSPEVPQKLMIGTAVVSGEVIGGVGETMVIELADSAHLHFEMQLDGKSVDPLSYCPLPQAVAAEAED